MQVDDVGRAGAFVQVVDILGYDTHVVFLLQADKLLVGLVGLCVDDILAAGIVEIEHQLGVAFPRLVGGNVLHTVLFPKSVAVAEGAYSAFGTDARTRQNYYFFHCFILFS